MSNRTEPTAFSSTRFLSSLRKCLHLPNRVNDSLACPELRGFPGHGIFSASNSQANWDNATTLPKILLLALCKALPTVISTPCP